MNRMVAMNTDLLNIRPMKTDDIPEGMRLKTAAGWNQTVSDWKLYLDLSPGGCFVAEMNGRIVGTITAINYHDSISWIGMMLVDPGYRRTGIASRLMRHALEYLGSCGTIKLDATPLGKMVYDRLGFRDEYRLLRLIARSPQVDKPSDTRISPLVDSDWTVLAVMDHAVFGADRIAVLRSFARHNPETALKIVRDGVLRGYCMGRPGTGFYQIGPVVAQTADDAFGLVNEATGALAGLPVVIDIPDNQHMFIGLLGEMGFSEERSFGRMYYNVNNNPGQPEYMFGISGPELG
ncbi:GNAT family N-acetyltransferase [bacterium]|nr:GNAT family N-acetyltransferase [bacterium]